jgi:hypothetical protein
VAVLAKLLYLSHTFVCDTDLCHVVMRGLHARRGSDNVYLPVSSPSAIIVPVIMTAQHPHIPFLDTSEVYSDGTKVQVVPSIFKCRCSVLSGVDLGIRSVGFKYNTLILVRITAQSLSDDAVMPNYSPYAGIESIIVCTYGIRFSCRDLCLVQIRSVFKI